MIKRIIPLSLIIIVLLFICGCQKQDQELAQESIKKWNTINYYADLMYTELGKLHSEGKLSDSDKNVFFDKGNNLFDYLDLSEEYMKEFVLILNSDEEPTDTNRARVRSQMNRAIYQYNDIRELFLVKYMAGRDSYIEIPKLERLR